MEESSDCWEMRKVTGEKFRGEFRSVRVSVLRGFGGGRCLAVSQYILNRIGSLTIWKSQANVGKCEKATGEKFRGEFRW